jgi:hemerythrin superfamily protein
MPTTRTSNRTPSRSTSQGSSRSTSRAGTAARTELLAQLKEDHKRVKKAYRDFQKLDAEQDPEAAQALVLQVLDELTVHATLEEELLYPAARGAIAEESLVDEAEVEHESVRMLIEQLRNMSPEDDKYVARFTVLCEYVMHHVKEEEGEMFPQLEKARLDWEALALQMDQRRAALMPEEETETEAAADGELAETGSASPSRSKPAARTQGSARSKSGGSSRT